MKCKCGHGEIEHWMGNGHCRHIWCDCAKHEPEEEKMEDETRTMQEEPLRRMTEAEVAGKLAAQTRYNEARFAVQEKLRRRDLFERIAIKLLPAFVGDASSDFWIEAIRARFTDLLKAEEEGL